MIKTKESTTAMKRYFIFILAVLMSAALLLTACQPASEDEAPTIASYEGYSNIPDLGNIAGAKRVEGLSSAAAARLSVDPESVFVYELGDIPADALKIWTKELKARGFEKSGTLEEAGNTVTWYSDDRKIGVVAGYMDTDKQGGMDAFGVFLVNKNLSGKYVDIDYETVQEAWGNANNGASFFIDDKKIFGYGYIGSADDGFLSKNTDSSSALMLVEGAHPRYVHEWDKTVYACLSDRLVAVDTKEKDPEEAVTTLVEGSLQSLQIVNETLYYTTKSGLYCCDFDGENVVKITGKKMKDAYVVGDKVYYCDTEDDNTEHAYSLMTEADTRVTEEAVSSFFLGSKGNGYYIAERDVEPEPADEEDETTDEETTKAAEDSETSEETTVAEEEDEEPATAWNLIRVSLKDGKTTELATVREGTALVGIGNKVYYVSDEHNGQIYSISKSGGTPKRVTRDEDCRNLMTFHDMILYYDYEDETEEGLEHIYISTPDGFMKSDILR